MTRRLALPLILLLIAGLLGGLLLLPRAQMPASGSPEVQFIQGMLQHHAQAVDMASRIRERSADRTIRSLALDIALSQTEQIRQMRGMLRRWHYPEGQPMSHHEASMIGMASEQELGTLGTLPVPQAETQFIRLMLRHHQGAVEMVKPVLSKATLPEVRLLANAMNTTQGSEINTMRQTLQRRGAQPLPSPMHMDMPEHEESRQSPASRRQCKRLVACGLSQMEKNGWDVVFLIAQSLGRIENQRDSKTFLAGHTPPLLRSSSSLPRG